VTRSRPHTKGRPAERGATLVELLVAASMGLSVAALLGHTMSAYQTGYHRAATRVSESQQAHFAVALMAAEVETLLKPPASASCPAWGIRVADGRLEFSANLYDRSTGLREDAPAGGSEMVVEEGSAFEAGDLVMVVDVQDPADPGDDIADCARISDISSNRWTLGRALARRFPAGSRVALVNRVAYALASRGLLMRTQDGGTQRVAQDVTAFDVRVEGSTVLIRLAMRNAGEWTRRVAVEEGG
jgi:hypothetical protein